MSLSLPGSVANLPELAIFDDGRGEFFFAVDADHRIVAINEPLLDCLGLRRDEALGRTLAAVLGQHELAAIGTKAYAAMQAGRRISSRETLAPGPDAEPRCFDFSFLPLTGAGDLALVGTAREVTRDRSFDAELAEAASREQRRLDRDLHDTLGQEFALASMLLQGLERRMAAEAPQLLPLSREIRDAIAQAFKSMRATVYGLMPTELAGNSLPVALAALAARFARHGDIDFSFVGPDSLAPLPPGTAEHVFRFAQEAVSNILRHASASTATIELKVDGANLVLAISDDGVGLDLTAALETGSMGLRIMRFRAQSIGGSVEFSSPGIGTRVVLTVPVSASVPSAR
jgi:signal transduction histidine kinase